MSRTLMQVGDLVTPGQDFKDGLRITRTRAADLSDREHLSWKQEQIGMIVHLEPWQVGGYDLWRAQVLVDGRLWWCNTGYIRRISRPQ
jgi:hypothetical protein